MRTKPGTKYPNLTGETTSAFRQACTPCQWHTWEGKGAWGPCRRPLPWHCHDSQLLIVHQSEGCLPENYLPKAFWGTGKCHAASPAFRSFCKSLLEAKNNHFWFFAQKLATPIRPHMVSWGAGLMRVASLTLRMLGWEAMGTVRGTFK